MYEDRIKCPGLSEKIMTAGQAAQLIQSGMTVCFSGFVSAGYPKRFPQALAAAGTAKDLTVITGASTGDELDGALARAGLVTRRCSFQTNKSMRAKINEGEVLYTDVHLGRLPGMIRDGLLGQPDYAVIECCMVTEEGGIVPTLNVGASNAFVECAKQVILELNVSVPADLRGIHDICLTPGGQATPFPAPGGQAIPFPSPGGQAAPLTASGQRIGAEAIFCPPERIAAIVIADEEGILPEYPPPGETSAQIAGHIVRFLRGEISQGRMPENLFPLQSGVGKVANAVLCELSHSGFLNLSMYTEVVQDGALDLLLSGVLSSVSAAAFSFSREGLKRFYENLDFFKERMVLRPQEISNCQDIIRSLRVIAMNTALEADIYGNVNSSHAFGSGIVNGIGGSAEYSRSAGLSIFMTPSTAKGGRISCIVPMVTHVDNIEHDVDVVVTEQGLADLRGKCPIERAAAIIENCAHPGYQAELWEYLKNARRNGYGQHTPHDLSRAFEMHLRYLKQGSMGKADE